MRVALDTNILAYAEGVNGTSMKTLALELVGGLPQISVVLPVQTLGELFQVLVRKAGRSPGDARSAILSWRNTFALFETSTAAMLAAADLAVDHRLSIWDAVILCVARRRIATCSCLKTCKMGLSGRGLRSSIHLPAPSTPC